MACSYACGPVPISRLTTLVVQRYAPNLRNFNFISPSLAVRSLSVQVRAVNKFPEAPFEPVGLPKVVAAGTSPKDWNGDLLLMATCEEDFQTTDEVVEVKSEKLLAFNDVFNGAILDIIQAEGFAGKQGQQSRVVRVGAPTGPKYIGLLGMGKAEKVSAFSDWGPSVYQTAGVAVTAAAKANKSTSAAVAFLMDPSAEAAGKLATGSLIGAFEAVRFKSSVKDGLKLEQIDILMPGVGQEVDECIKRAQAVAGGNLFTRYLVEAPPNVATPTHLAESAEYLAKKYPETMSVRILEKAECEEMGMGCYLGVSECAGEPPKFIHLTYTPTGGVKRKVAIVGKGVTFDSGGYNLKVSGMIELMKFDMGGSAAVLGAANIIGALQPPGTEVHFIVPACENMVDGKGLKPGDVLRAANGKTVEVNNTDAEGRLTLVDGIWYAQEKLGITTVVDVATLTGAAIVALGTEVAAVFTDDDKLCNSLVSASKTVGEKLWRLPLESSYSDMLKSSCADMKNTGSRWGGAITGALFIKDFVNEGVEWAHMDIAGPVWNEKLGLPTGYGAATLAAWVESLNAKEEGS